MKISSLKIYTFLKIKLEIAENVGFFRGGFIHNYLLILKYEKYIFLDFMKIIFIKIYTFFKKKKNDCTSYFVQSFYSKCYCRYILCKKKKW